MAFEQLAQRRCSIKASWRSAIGFTSEGTAAWPSGALLTRGTGRTVLPHQHGWLGWRREDHACQPTRSNPANRSGRRLKHAVDGSPRAALEKPRSVPGNTTGQPPRRNRGAQRQSVIDRVLT